MDAKDVEAGARPVSDHDLLREYATSGSHAAFAGIVERHVDLVYAAARRQVGGDAHLAEDVTQTVFLLLADKARRDRIRPGVIIAGWLYTATGYAAANLRRAESGRRRHEWRAGILSGALQNGRDREDGEPSGWNQVEPLLDEALSCLCRAEREAVLLKFMQGKSHRAVGEAMGISEEAARKRVGRAIERLRELLLRRGVALSAAGLATMMTTRCVDAAPTGLTASCGVPGTLPASHGMLVRGVEVLMGWVKAKLLVASLTAAVIVTVGSGVRAHLRRTVTSPVIPVALAGVAAARPSGTIEGSVVTVAGEPVSDAEVFLVAPAQRVYVYDPRPRLRPLVTEIDGKFSFPRPDGDWMIIARTADGYGQAYDTELAKSPLVVLRPWGRIEGTVYAGSKPLAGVQVRVDECSGFPDPLAGSADKWREVKTDANGHFAVDRVAPGEAMVCQQTVMWSLRSKWECVRVEPGKSVKVDLGTRGRPVTGRVLMPASEEQFVFATDREHESAVSVYPMPRKWWDRPANWDKLPRDKQLELQREWDRTPQGREFRRIMFGEEYPVAPDGTIRIDALRPGQYMLDVRHIDRDGDTGVTGVVGHGHAQFTVPATPDGGDRSDEAVQLPP
ncbi:MAG TPA: sigma-70 family RNA polymerase sigma factor, partial [Tepidisphaeraceae bacterium]